MSSLSSTAEEILSLFDGPRVHPDPKVDRQILLTDIENVLCRSEAIANLEAIISQLDHEKRQLEREIENLEDLLEDAEGAA